MPTEQPPAPLSAADQGIVCQRVAEEIDRAARWLGVILPPIEVRFDLSGTSAGMYCQRGEQRWLRFNPWLFAKDLPLHLHDTVIHEVAHYAINIRYGRRRLQPHGAEWQALMVALGADPKATFQADMAGIPVRRQRRYGYVCSCREHALSATRHNRIVRRRAVYRCSYCHGKLTRSAE